MNKQDVMDAIEGKFESVFSYTMREELGNVKWYLAYVFDVSGNNATKKNVGFYVEDEGTVDEKAFWHGNEPKPTPPTPSPTFQQKLQERLSTLISAGTIQAGTIQAVDSVNKTATASILLVINSILVEKRFLIDKDAQDDWRRREIIS